MDPVTEIILIQEIVFHDDFDWMQRRNQQKVREMTQQIISKITNMPEEAIDKASVIATKMKLFVKRANKQKNGGKQNFLEDNYKWLEEAELGTFQFNTNYCKGDCENNTEGAITITVTDNHKIVNEELMDDIDEFIEETTEITECVEHDDICPLPNTPAHQTGINTNTFYPQTPENIGAPKKAFNKLSKRTQRHRVQKIQTEINKLTGGDTDELSAFKKRLCNYCDDEDCENDQHEYTLACLALMKKARLSRNQYLDVRFGMQDFARRGYDLLNMPSYNSLRAERVKCIPAGINVTVKKAEVNIQDVLDHTVKRTLERPDVDQLVENNDIIENVVKIGGDAQTGMGDQNRYVETEDNEIVKTGSAYNEGIVPLVIKVKAEGENAEKELYRNPTPGGEDALRPTLKSTEKDTEDFVIKRNYELTTEIENLKELKFTTKTGKNVTVTHKVVKSMNDGKNVTIMAKNHIKTEHEKGNKLKDWGDKKTLNNNTCVVCLGSDKQYNTKFVWEAKMFNYMKQYGLSPMHGRIRSMELLWKAACHKMSKLFGGTCDEWKKNFQEQFESEMAGGLRIFRPEPSGGNSNTGNVAKRFFEHSFITSTILNIPESLVQNMWEVLKMINQTHTLVDSQYYEQQAQLVWAEYVKELGEYQKMTGTVHKILSHGRAYIEWAQHEVGVPLGALTEGSIEMGNKQNKTCIRSFSRKDSFVNESTDVFVRRMWGSDPLIIWEETQNTKLRRGNIRKRKAGT